MSPHHLLLFVLSQTIFSFTGYVAAQQNQIEIINEAQGLSDNRIHCFYKDRQGFIWIGTANGLNRYDGRSFRIFTPAGKRDYLSNEFINSITEDARGNLWIATRGGLNILNSRRDSLIVYKPGNNSAGQEKKVTNTLGYDGGAWFSPDGKKIIWRASRPKTEAEVKEYKELLADNLVAPTNMEVFVANADGSDAHQITNFGQANWAPAFFPDSKQIIFASNYKYKRGFPFDLYSISEDGTGLTQLTHSNTFDAFPMFSPDGKKIVFCSNRNNGGTRDTNVFIADWVE